MAAMDAYMKMMAKKEAEREAQEAEDEAERKRQVPLLNETSFDRRKVREERRGNLLHTPLQERQGSCFLMVTLLVVFYLYSLSVFLSFDACVLGRSRRCSRATAREGITCRISFQQRSSREFWPR